MASQMKEEDIIFSIELELFLIGTISVFETIQFMKTIDVEIHGYKCENKIGI